MRLTVIGRGLFHLVQSLRIIELLKPTCFRHWTLSEFILLYVVMMENEDDFALQLFTVAINSLLYPIKPRLCVMQV